MSTLADSYTPVRKYESWYDVLTDKGWTPVHVPYATFASAAVSSWSAWTGNSIWPGSTKLPGWYTDNGVCQSSVEPDSIAFAQYNHIPVWGKVNDKGYVFCTGAQTYVFVELTCPLGGYLNRPAPGMPLVCFREPCKCDEERVNGVCTKYTTLTSVKSPNNTILRKYLFDKYPHQFKEFSEAGDKCYQDEPQFTKCPADGKGNPVGCAAGDKRHSEFLFSANEQSVQQSYRRINPADTAVPSSWQLSNATTVSEYVLPTNAVDRVFKLEDGNQRRIFFVGDKSTTSFTSYNGLYGVLTLDANGYLIQYRDGSSKHFNSSGQLDRITNASGRATAFAYSGGRLQSTTAPTGRMVSFTYDGNGYLQSMTEPNGNITRFTFNNGVLTSIIYPDTTPAIDTDNPRKQFLYEDARFADALTGIVDENNVRFATYTYDDKKRVVAENHAGIADKSTFEYLSDQTTLVGTRLSEQSLSEELYTFNKSGGVYQFAKGEQMPCPGCTIGTESKTFDGNGNVTQKQDRVGNTTSYVYDNLDRETSRTEGFGSVNARTITTQYDGESNRPTVITTDKSVTTMTYSNGLMQSRTVQDVATSLSQTTTYTYTNGLVTQIDGPRTDVSDITTYTYDAQGNVSTITNALGHVTQITAYDANGKPLTMIDPNGLQTTLTYTPRGWLETRTVGTLKTTFMYDKVGQLTKVTMPDASFIAYEYDAAHRLTTIKNKAGEKIVYTLDYAGNRIKEEIFNAAGTKVYTHSRNFNALNQLIEEVNAQNQITARYGYDANGQLTGQQRELDGAAQATNVQTYDSLNRLSKITDALNGVTDLAYDTQDSLTGVTDPKRLNTAYNVDGLGQLKQTSSPDTGSTTQTFDSAGNIKTSTNANGKTTTYSYDALNRVTKITYHDNSTVTFTYDTSTTSNFGKGRLSKIVDASGNTTFVYNQRGQLTTKTQTISGKARAHKYGYDSYGRLSTYTLPSTKVVKYVYNTNGQISSLQVAGVNQLTNITYQPFGGVKSFTYANGKTFNRTFDLNGRLDSFALANQTVSVAYDLSNRITAVGNNTYQYDALDRLKTVTQSSSGVSFDYDANGNRTQRGDANGYSTYTTSSTSNRLATISGTQTVNYQYDNAGNITSDGVSTFTFNAANRLSKAQNASATGDYVYNGLGQRVKKTVTQNSVATVNLFAYDEAGRITGIYDAAAALIQEVVYLGDIPVIAITPAGNFYIHSDQLNTPREITNASGITVWKWDNVDAFGANAANDDPDSDAVKFVFNRRFAGQYFDSETGLHYNLNRNYDPKTGRYIESDPIGLDGGINTYGYVLGNPLSFTDPTGLSVATAAVPWTLPRPIVNPTTWRPAAPSPWTLLIYMSSAGEGSDVIPAIDTKTKEQCDDEKECGPLTRVQAYFKAQALAQIPRPGRVHIPFSAINLTSRGANCAELLRQGASYAGYFCGWNRLHRIEDHPDGHPHMPGEDHHNCPHLHVYDETGELIARIKYKRSSI